MELDLIKLIGNLFPQGRIVGRLTNFFINLLLRIIRFLFGCATIIATVFIPLLILVNLYYYVGGYETLIGINLRENRPPIRIYISESVSDVPLNPQPLLYSNIPQTIILTTERPLKQSVVVALSSQHGILTEPRDSFLFPFPSGVYQSYQIKIQNDLTQLLPATLVFTHTNTVTGLNVSLPTLVFTKEPRLVSVLRKIILVTSGEVLLTVIPLLIVVLAAAARQIEQRRDAPPAFLEFVRLAEIGEQDNLIKKAHKDLQQYTKYLNYEQKTLVDNYNLPINQLLLKLYDKNERWRDAYFGIILASDSEKLKEQLKIIVESHVFFPNPRLLDRLGLPPPSSSTTDSSNRGGGFSQGAEKAEHDTLKQVTSES
jgi:hypothetical protein